MIMILALSMKCMLSRFCGFLQNRRTGHRAPKREHTVRFESMAVLERQGSMAQLDDAQLGRLRDIFDAIDTDGSDELDYTELKEALQNEAGVELSLKELKQLWVNADVDASSGITFDEFCSAVAKMENSDLKKTLTSQPEDENSNCCIS